MMARFERDSRASGLNYEKIVGAKDPNMRSLRIDGGYRAVVLKPAEGNVHILLWADKHDDAYQWATRHACSINAETGALQVYQPHPAAEEAAETPRADTPGIFGQLKHRELLRLGVPAAMAAEVLEIRDEAALEEMAPRLPVEAYEALFLYMAGRDLRADYPRARIAAGAGGHHGLRDRVAPRRDPVALRRHRRRPRAGRDVQRAVGAVARISAPVATPTGRTSLERTGAGARRRRHRQDGRRHASRPLAGAETCLKANEFCSRPSPATLRRTSRTTCVPSVRRRK